MQQLSESTLIDQSNDTLDWDVYCNDANWYANLCGASGGGTYLLDYPVMPTWLEYQSWCQQFGIPMQLSIVGVAELESDTTYGTPYAPCDEQNNEYPNAGITNQQYGLPHDISSGEGYLTCRMSDTVAEAAAPTPSQASTCGSEHSVVRKARRAQNQYTSRRKRPEELRKDRHTIPTFDKDYNNYAIAELLVEHLESGPKIPVEELDRAIFPVDECVQKVKNDDGTNGLRCEKSMKLVKSNDGRVYWKSLGHQCAQVMRSSESYRRHVLALHCATPTASRRPDSPSRKSAKRKHAEEPSAPGPSKRRRM